MNNTEYTNYIEFNKASVLATDAWKKFEAVMWDIPDMTREEKDKILEDMVELKEYMVNLQTLTKKFFPVASDSSNNGDNINKIQYHLTSKYAGRCIQEVDRIRESMIEESEGK